VWGVSVAATVVCARVAAGLLGHWIVGYVAHTHGYVRWAIDGAPVAGKNTWLLGALSFGEGFHNNHHAHPGSARMGQVWWELDLGWAMIRLLERVGLVAEVRSCDRGGTLKPGARAA
jgi:stearoyl-CoA desaturase (delta-9 desaturase)